jgi:hypothetical protein
MVGRMDCDTVPENVERLTRLLEAATDEAERKSILKLLEGVRAKLRKADAD